ncbi:hypothetical protein KW419_18285 [Vibrio fluvialis]|nr:hypothetical protein [Vibrio fluvialis]MBY7899905.1 hypothetical protein [Vibrio fluvialis]MBY7938614.1 hypothetical protein [Vibrio fluvialis]
MRFRRRNRHEFSSKDLKSIAEHLEKITKPKSKFVTAASVASSFSQVLMLGVVVFGYVYTVIPVVQKERIAEQLATLEIEKKDWDERLERFNQSLIKKEEELERLELVKAQLQTELNQLENDKVSLTSNLKGAESEYKLLSNELTSVKTKLGTATEELYKQQKRQLLGKEPLPANLIAVLGRNGYQIPFISSDKEQIDVLKSSYYSPYQYAEQVLDSLHKLVESASGVDKEAKAKLYRDYKSGLKSNGSLLMCPTPNYSAWDANYKEAKKLSLSYIPACVERLFDDRIAQEKWSESEVKMLRKTDFWKEQTKSYASNCKWNSSNIVNELFTESWEVVTEPCQKRAFSVNDVVFGEKTIVDLGEFVDMSPPTIPMVVLKLDAEMANVKF